jgi:hypothetical protein
VRLKALLAPRGPLPVCPSTVWSWVKLGRFPQPVRMGSRITAWRVAEVRSFLASLGTPESAADKPARARKATNQPNGANP